ncbi:MAG: (d)CMP kinase [Bifidobacteriaceae bacterium]|jgi:cytidylate kinase|nr:(d)CMP kinase [Bifidobacteriaceae bacterium]
MALTVAIDGPSGSGKSTVARAVAAARRLAYLDTGAMYRAAACWVLDSGAAFDDLDGVAALVRDMPLTVGLDPAGERFTLDGRDVTARIREPEVSRVVSRVATNLKARPLLVDWQRRLVAAEREPGGWSGGRGIVAEGRDITTVIAPDAEVRILLTASEEARLARRSLELSGSADASAVAATRDQVVRRDRDDSTVASFMEAADGVTLLDSSALTLEETIARVLALVPEV